MFNETASIEAEDLGRQAQGRRAQAERCEGRRFAPSPGRVRGTAPRPCDDAAALRGAGRTGKAFSDRFHAHVLKTMREVANAVRYVLENFRHHLREDVAPQGADPCSSAAWLGAGASDDAPILSPRTWLLRHGAPATRPS